MLRSVYNYFYGESYCSESEDSCSEYSEDFDVYSEESFADSADVVDTSSGVDTENDDVIDYNKHVCIVCRKSYLFSKINKCSSCSMFVHNRCLYYDKTKLTPLECKLCAGQEVVDMCVDREKEMYILSAKDICFKDLSYRDLREYDFSEMDLRNYDFSFSNMSCSDFINTNMESSKFIKTNLSACNMSGSNLENSICTETNFTGANLTFAKMENIELTGAIFKNIVIDYNSKLYN